MHLYKVKRFGQHRPLIISLLVFAVAAALIVALLNQTQQRSSSEQLTLLRDALRNAAADCYAVEGRYPPTLAYLEDNYGVVIDRDKFAVRYDAFAENLMPEISVQEIGRELANDAEERA